MWPGNAPSPVLHPLLRRQPSVCACVPPGHLTRARPTPPDPCLPGLGPQSPPRPAPPASGPSAASLSLLPSPASSASVAAPPSAMSGHPSLRPAGALCFLPRTRKLMRLRPSFIVRSSPRRRATAQVYPVTTSPPFCGRASPSLRTRSPSTATSKGTSSSASPRRKSVPTWPSGACALRGSASCCTPGATSWGAEPVQLLFKVFVEIHGIPDHAWHRRSAEMLLAPFCQIEDLDHDTRLGLNMSVFKLSAWTPNPDAIPHVSELFLPERDVVMSDTDLDRAERLAMNLLRWPVSIHVSQSVDYRRPLPPPPPPPHAGNDGDSVGDAGGDLPPPPPRWPQRHDFPSHVGSSGQGRAHAPTSARQRGAGARHRRLPSRGWQAILGPHPPIPSTGPCDPSHQRISKAARVGPTLVKVQHALDESVAPTLEAPPVLQQLLTAP